MTMPHCVVRFYMTNLLSAFMANAIHYEDTVFEPSGFWNDPDRSTAYEGPPTPENNKAWDNLTEGKTYSALTELLAKNT